MNAGGVQSAQLLVYGFGREADMEGQLVGALERIESDGGGRIVDALFLRSKLATGELSVFALRGGAVGKLVVPALDFRLDAGRRRRTTERVLRDGTAGMTGQEVKAIADGLEPGSAIAAVLLQHASAELLDDAVSRLGGAPLANRLVDANALTAELLAGLRPG
jgi:hypothetical protein